MKKLRFSNLPRVKQLIKANQLLPPEPLLRREGCYLYTVEPFRYSAFRVPCYKKAAGSYRPPS